MDNVKKILILNFAVTCSIVQVLSACLSEMKKKKKTTLPTLTSLHGSGIMQWLLQDEHSSDEDCQTWHKTQKKTLVDGSTTFTPPLPQRLSLLFP